MAILIDNYITFSVIINCYMILVAMEVLLT